MPTGNAGCFLAGVIGAFLAVYVANVVLLGELDDRRVGIVAAANAVVLG